MSLTPERQLELFRSMLHLRNVELRIEELYHLDQMKTPVHLCIGQEAISVETSAEDGWLTLYGRHEPIWNRHFDPLRRGCQGSGYPISGRQVSLLDETPEEIVPLGFSEGLGRLRIWGDLFLSVRFLIAFRLGAEWGLIFGLPVQSLPAGIFPCFDERTLW